jgi:hypothetical protein
MAGPVDPDLITDPERRQQRNRPDPFEIHLVLAEIRLSPRIHRLAHRICQRQTGARLSA